MSEAQPHAQRVVEGLIGPEDDINRFVYAALPYQLLLPLLRSRIKHRFSPGTTGKIISIEGVGDIGEINYINVNPTDVSVHNFPQPDDNWRVWWATLWIGTGENFQTSTIKKPGSSDVQFGPSDVQYFSSATEAIEALLRAPENEVKLRQAGFFESAQREAFVVDKHTNALVQALAQDGWHDLNVGVRQNGQQIYVIGHNALRHAQKVAESLAAASATAGLLTDDIEVARRASTAPWQADINVTGVISKPIVADPATPILEAESDDLKSHLAGIAHKQSGAADYERFKALIQLCVADPDVHPQFVFDAPENSSRYLVVPVSRVMLATKPLNHPIATVDLIKRLRGFVEQIDARSADGVEGWATGKGCILTFSWARHVRTHIRYVYNELTDNGHPLGFSTTSGGFAMAVEAEEQPAPNPEDMWNVAKSRTIIQDRENLQKIIDGLTAVGVKVKYFTDRTSVRDRHIDQRFFSTLEMTVSVTDLINPSSPEDFTVIDGIVRNVIVSSIIDQNPHVLIDWNRKEYGSQHNDRKVRVVYRRHSGNPDLVFTYHHGDKEIGYYVYESFMATAWAYRLQRDRQLNESLPQTAWMYRLQRDKQLTESLPQMAWAYRQQKNKQLTESLPQTAWAYRLRRDKEALEESDAPQPADLIGPDVPLRVKLFDLGQTLEKKGYRGLLTFHQHGVSSDSWIIVNAWRDETGPERGAWRFGDGLYQALIDIRNGVHAYFKGFVDVDFRRNGDHVTCTLDCKQPHANKQTVINIYFGGKIAEKLDTVFHVEHLLEAINPADITSPEDRIRALLYDVGQSLAAKRYSGAIDVYFHPRATPPATTEISILLTKSIGTEPLQTVLTDVLGLIRAKGIHLYIKPKAPRVWSDKGQTYYRVNMLVYTWPFPVPHEYGKDISMRFGLSSESMSPVYAVKGINPVYALEGINPEDIIPLNDKIRAKIVTLCETLKREHPDWISGIVRFVSDDAYGLPPMVYYNIQMQDDPEEELNKKYRIHFEIKELLDSLGLTVLRTHSDPGAVYHHNQLGYISVLQGSFAMVPSLDKSTLRFTHSWGDVSSWWGPRNESISPEELANDPEMKIRAMMYDAVQALLAAGWSGSVSIRHLPYADQPQAPVWKWTFELWIFGPILSNLPGASDTTGYPPAERKVYHSMCDVFKSVGFKAVRTAFNSRVVSLSTPRIPHLFWDGRAEGPDVGAEMDIRVSMNFGKPFVTHVEESGIDPLSILPASDRLRMKVIKACELAKQHPDWIKGTIAIDMDGSQTRIAIVPWKLCLVSQPLPSEVARIEMGMEAVLNAAGLRVLKIHQDADTRTDAKWVTGMFEVETEEQRDIFGFTHHWSNEHLLGEGIDPGELANNPEMLCRAMVHDATTALAEKGYSGLVSVWGPTPAYKSHHNTILVLSHITSTWPSWQQQDTMGFEKHRAFDDFQQAFEAAGFKDIVRSENSGWLRDSTHPGNRLIWSAHAHGPEMPLRSGKRVTLEWPFGGFQEDVAEAQEDDIKMDSPLVEPGELYRKSLQNSVHGTMARLQIMAAYIHQSGYTGEIEISPIPMPDIHRNPDKTRYLHIFRLHPQEYMQKSATIQHGREVLMRAVKAAGITPSEDFDKGKLLNVFDRDEAYWVWSYMEELPLGGKMPERNIQIKF